MDKIDNFANRLKIAMDIREISQSELSTRSKIWKSAISAYLKGDYEAKQDKVDVLASVLNVSPLWLMGYDVPSTRETPLPSNVIPIHKVRMIPIIGGIACGDPIWAEENYDGWFALDNSIKADFVLKARGDSMIDVDIKNGNKCFIKKTECPENGKIMAVLIDGSATLKRLYKTETGWILNSENKEYTPIVIEGDIHVLGELVGVYKTDF